MDVEVVDQILAQQVHHESQKSKVEKNTPCAETVAGVVATLALVNRTNVSGCCPTSSAKVMIGKQQRQGGRERMREGVGGNNRGG